MSEGLKYDRDKAPWRLLVRGCRAGLAGALRVLGMGMRKYGEDNWQLVTPHDRYIDALYRHLDAVMQHGLAARDAESGELHIHHVTTNALFLAHFAEQTAAPMVPRASTVLSVHAAEVQREPNFRPRTEGSDFGYTVPTGVVPRRETGGAAVQIGGLANLGP